MKNNLICTCCTGESPKDCQNFPYGTLIAFDSHQVCPDRDSDDEDRSDAILCFWNGDFRIVFNFRAANSRYSFEDDWWCTDLQNKTKPACTCCGFGIATIEEYFEITKLAEPDNFAIGCEDSVTSNMRCVLAVRCMKAIWSFRKDSIVACLPKDIVAIVLREIWNLREECVLMPQEEEEK